MVPVFCTAKSEATYFGETSTSVKHFAYSLRSSHRRFTRSGMPIVRKANLIAVLASLDVGPLPCHMTVESYHCWFQSICAPRLLMPSVSSFNQLKPVFLQRRLAVF